MIFDITITLDTSSVSVISTDDIAIEIVLDAEQIQPASICEQIDDCLNIPTVNGQYVLTITDNVISWEEFSATGLVDGNGTTINGNKVDLGGTISQNTTLSYNPNNNYILLGDDDACFLYGSVGDSIIRFNVDYDNASIASSPDINDEISIISVDRNADMISTVIKQQTFGAGYDYGIAILDKTQFGGVGKSTNIYYGSNDGAGNTADLIRIEVLATDEETSHAHMRRFIDFTTPVNYNGVHVNKYYSQLEYNKVNEDDQDTGTLWTLNEDGATHYQSGNVLNQFDNSGNLLFGDAITDGTWKFFLDSGNFSIQKRESGSWVTKQTWA